MTVTPDAFAVAMRGVWGPGNGIPVRIAVAVSGGADSMALMLLLIQWTQGLTHPVRIDVLTVDHGLRPESKAEAQQVAMWVKQRNTNGSGVRHKILTWTGSKPKTRVQEAARAARYRLMAEYCRDHDIHHLFLAHHADDQAETVLMRLASGSGVDGLAGMAVQSKYTSGLTLCRPLLNVTHEALVDFLKQSHQDWIEDPSNQNKKYARVRLRAARDVLAAEGLTSDRLGRLAVRAGRARTVLQQVADRAWDQSVQAVHQDQAGETGAKMTRGRAALFERSGVVWSVADWDGWADDTRVRVMTRAIETVSGSSPRMEQVEDLVDALRPGQMTVSGRPKTIRRTLAGCVITRGAKRVKVMAEQSNGD